MLVAVAVDVIGSEAQTDSAAAALDVGFPSGVVGRDREFRLVLQRDRLAGPKDTVIPEPRIVGGGFKRGEADVALHVGEVEKARALNQGGGDPFAHFLVAVFG